MTEGWVSDETRAAANLATATTVVAQLQQSGVTDVFIAPGARSTPLIVALTKTDVFAHERLHVFVDERSAAFAALGFAKSTDTPAVVVTTSGTAVANLLPAATEASLDGVPLVLLTADRPQGAFERGENQAIDQASLLSVVTRTSVDFAPAEAMSTRTAAESVGRALAVATGANPGPVHLNVRFAKPLVTDAAINAMTPPQALGAMWSTPTLIPNRDAMNAAQACIRNARAGLIVTGRFANEADRKAAAAFITDAPWPTLACASSGMPNPASVGADVWCEAEAFRRGVKPDVVLWLGATLVSERMMRWMAACGATRVIQVDPRPRGFDPMGATTDRLVASVAAFVEGLSPTDCSPSALVAPVKAAAGAAEAAKEVLAAAASSPTLASIEPQVARVVAESVSNDGTLVVGASMPIRDLDAFAAPLVTGARIVTNRGASGIDGVLSTAVGAALAGRPTTLVIGDVSMVHDLSAMTLLAQVDVKLRVIVVDNRGGGIFSFLPLARSRPETVDPWFRSPPVEDLSFAGVASAVGVPALVVESTDALERAVAHPPTAAEVVVVKTDAQTNVATHDHWRATIVAAVEDAR